MKKYKFFVCRCGYSLARLTYGKEKEEEICQECNSVMAPVVDEKEIEELNDFFFGKKDKND